jgi:hypothetical protein
MVLAVGVTMMTDAAVAGLIGFGGLTLGLLGVLSTWIIWRPRWLLPPKLRAALQTSAPPSGASPVHERQGCPACGNVSVEAGAGRPTRQNIAPP